MSYSQTTKTTSSSSSAGGVKGRQLSESDSGSLSGGRQSNIAVRTFMISRSDPNASRNCRVSSSMSSRGSMGGGMGLSAGVAQQLSQAGITGFKGDREKEKQQMQQLNERLANYIERVNFYLAENQRLEAENEALRNRKGEDLQPIRDMYENELQQARKVIDELSVKQGVAEAKVTGLNDEIRRLQDLIATYEIQAVDYRKKLSALDAQIGDLEGELASLRARFGSRDDESDKQRDLILKYQDQIRNLREDLDQETAAHIESECLAQTKSEECAFYRDLLDQLELMKPEPIKIKGMEAADFWQQHMKKAIRDIQAACDEKVNLMQQDCEAKFASQVQAMKSGAVKDNMQLASSKEEVTKLRGQLSESKAAYAALAQKIGILTAERDSYAARVSELETQMDEMRLKYDSQIQALEMELAGVMEQLRVLMDAKLSMELEIACYKKLLEGEEQRSSFRSLVESSLGSSSSGGQALSAALGGASMSSSSSSSTQQSSGSMSSSSGRMQVQRRSKGAVGFSSIDHSGGSVVIENDGKNASSKTVSLGGWKIVKKTGDRVVHEVMLKDYSLGAGQSFTVWAKGAKESTSASNEQVAEVFSFGVGNCVWSLIDNSGDEKATLTANFL